MEMRWKLGFLYMYITYLWLAGHEGMHKKMEATLFFGSTVYRDYSFEAKVNTKIIVVTLQGVCKSFSRRGP